MSLRKPAEQMHYILATDVGSTTTKARFFSRKSGEWRFFAAGEAPTTVETPYEDVTLGVRNAIREVEELTGHPILFEDGSGIVLPYDGKRGVDLYCTTSSAGGGLQMLVAGVITTMTAQSANRAALGAGAIVVDVVSMDDGRRDFEKIRRIRHIRPDMILLAGGTDDGTVVNVMNIAELINAAGPRPRLGDEFTIPLVYAGNKSIHNEIRNLMKDNFALTIVDNLRPVLEVEHVEPAREAIHEQFMEHVMSHAPGYDRLMKWTDVDIMPTPAGEGMAMRLIAETYNMNVLGVGLGGATTNVYSVIDGRFVRSVSANLGMSYSICNVLKEAGIENIMRWLPFDMSEKDVGNRLMNKMIRPTTIPQTLKELILEHSTAREALRLGLAHHRTIATRLKGVRVERTMADLFEQQMEETYVKMPSIDIIVGTGGLLSHAPLRVQSMMVMIDAFQPEGVTRIFQDSVFMMPHLGVLSTVYKDAAWSIFEKDCLVPVGTVIAPTGTSKTEGDKVMMVDVEIQGKETVHREVGFGEIECIPLPSGTEAKVIVDPQRGFDLGAGSGHKIEDTAMGGVVGLVLDARGRPLELPADPDTRKGHIMKWINSLNIYPKKALEEIAD